MEELCKICGNDLPFLPSGLRNPSGLCNTCYEIESRLQISNIVALRYFRNRVAELISLGAGNGK